MVSRSALPLLVACSQFIGGCWAGPILLKSTISVHKESDLWPRSSEPASNHTIWIVIAVVGALLLALILVVAVLVRKHNIHRNKSSSDEEFGFGQNPGAQPHLVLPPRAYDGVRSSQSPLTIEDSQHPRSVQQASPPMLTVSPPEEIGQKPRRVPVPDLPTLSPSFRSVGLPPSPRLLKSPSSDRLSPHIEQLSTPSAVTSSSRDLDRLGFTQPATSQLSRNRLEVPLSADSLERTMMQMERELRVKEEIRFRVPQDR